MALDDRDRIICPLPDRSQADGGDLVQLELQYVRGPLARSKVETMPHSAVKPERLEGWRWPRTVRISTR